MYTHICIIHVYMHISPEAKHFFSRHRGGGIKIRAPCAGYARGRRVLVAMTLNELLSMNCYYY